jgi:hypothetical protein
MSLYRRKALPVDMVRVSATRVPALMSYSIVKQRSKEGEFELWVDGKMPEWLLEVIQLIPPVIQRVGGEVAVVDLFGNVTAVKDGDYLLRLNDEPFVAVITSEEFEREFEEVSHDGS